VLKRAAVIEAVGASDVTSGTATGVAKNSDAVGGANWDVAVLDATGSGVHDAGPCAVLDAAGSGVHDAGPCRGNPEDVAPSKDGDQEFDWPS